MTNFRYAPPPPLEALERDAIEAALEYFKGNQTKAAEWLGISARTIRRRKKSWEASSQSVSRKTSQVANLAAQQTVAPH